MANPFLTSIHLGCRKKFKLSDLEKNSQVVTILSPVKSSLIPHSQAESEIAKLQKSSKRGSKKRKRGGNQIDEHDVDLTQGN